MSWIEAANWDTLEAGKGVSLKLGHERIALFRVGDKPYALRDLCPHQGALLSTGGAYEQKSGPPIVVCPVHFWTFSLVDGHSPSGPSHCAVPFSAELRGGKVWIDIPQPEPAANS